MKGFWIKSNFSFQLKGILVIPNVTWVFWGVSSIRFERVYTLLLFISTRTLTFLLFIFAREDLVRLKPQRNNVLRRHGDQRHGVE